MSPPARGARETALAALFFLAATAVLTWPQISRLDDGLTDLGDAKLVTRILHWDYRQTFRDPANLFHLNFFHPAPFVLAFSENFYGVSLFGFPVLAAGAPALLNYNLMLLLGMFLSAFSAWALARYVTGDPLAAAVAGLVFAFVPWHFSQLAHLQFQWGGFLCLLLLFLLRYLDHGRTRDAVLFGAALAWNALCNVHYALFSGFLVGLTLLLYALEGRPGAGRRLRGACLAAAVGTLVFLPFALPYRKAAELYGMQRYFGEMEFYSGRWESFLSAGDANRLYGASTTRWRAPEGDFFPGLAALALAGVGLAMRRRQTPGTEAKPAQEHSRAPRGGLRALDVGIAVLTALWIASLAWTGLELGPLRLRDPGRIQVFLTVAVLARLAVAFPRWAPYADLGALLRRSAADRRLLFLSIGVLGVVVALGAHTPYYRFLFQSFGDVFRAIRAPARGIVLFHLALAVLAAGGLASLLRGRTPARRLVSTGLVVLLLGVEYRAFPLTVHPVSAEAPAVYDWLRTTSFPGAVVEWPLGSLYDFEYVFRQTAHEKPLVNGYSGFFPKPYAELQALLKGRPIPYEAWDAMRRLDASVLVYHSHEGRGVKVLEYAYAVRRGLARGRIESVGVFGHDGGRDFAFRLTDSPGAPPESQEFEATVRALEKDVARLAPPFGTVHLPAENQKVAPGFWCHGWALDDSGIAEIRVAVPPSAATAPVQIGRTWPGLLEAYPDYVAPGNGGYGFLVPDLPAGPHELRITLVGRDGGETVISRRILVAR